ncbi:MAG: arginine deiminase family protein [Bacillota bacterium]|nr:arginine deiminase family protein [Bacillota bacterium]
MVQFGTEKLGKLKSVMLHTPYRSLDLINRDNYKYYLFNKVPHHHKFIKEHIRYEKFLKSLGIVVFQLSNLIYENQDLLYKLPNLAYLHDVGVVLSKGAILSRMCPGGREHEETVLKEALTRLGIPTFHQFNKGEKFEGCLVLSPDTLLVANTERHTEASIMKSIPKFLEIFKKVIYVKIPKLRRYMHTDMIYNRISDSLALAYLPAFLKTFLFTKDTKIQIDFENYMSNNGVEVINISNREQLNWGCSFVPLEPNIIIHYDFSLNTRTQSMLKERGVRIIKFHPDALLAGGGSLRCFTLRLYREV